MKTVLVVLLGLSIGLVFSCGKQATVDDVVNMIAQASGGAEKLQSITDQVSTWDFTMHIMPPMPEQPMAEGQETGAMEQSAEQAGEEMSGEMAGQPMPMVITYKRPNKIRMDFNAPDGTTQMSSCYDGTKGWETMMGQQRDFSEAQSQEYETMGATWIDGFVDYQQKGLTLALLPNELADGTKYIVLQSTDKHGNTQKYYINETTHVIEKQLGEMMNMEGQKEATTMTFKDYKIVDGVNMAHHVASFNSNGELVWEAALKEVKHNTSVDDAMFMAQPMTAK
ncbi:MAG TPA: hypothetical protein VGA99_08755 [bacterium]